jgi:hypothetical protein
LGRVVVAGVLSELESFDASEVSASALFLGSGASSGEVVSSLASLDVDEAVDDESDPSDVPLVSLDVDEAVDDESDPSDVSADATPVPVTIAAPIPRATASPPIRPTYAPAPMPIYLPWRLRRYRHLD